MCITLLLVRVYGCSGSLVCCRLGVLCPLALHLLQRPAVFRSIPSLHSLILIFLHFPLIHTHSYYAAQSNHTSPSIHVHKYLPNSHSPIIPTKFLFIYFLAHFVWIWTLSSQSYITHTYHVVSYTSIIHVVSCHVLSWYLHAHHHPSNTPHITSLTPSFHICIVHDGWGWTCKCHVQVSCSCPSVMSVILPHVIVHSM